MRGLQASTQYGDHKGSVSISWHHNMSSSLNGLDGFAETIGIPTDEIAFGIRLWRASAFNRTDPIEDTRETPSIVIYVYTVSTSDLNGMDLPTYFESTPPSEVRIKSHGKEFTDILSMLNWFKEIDIVAFNPNLLSLDLTNINVEE